MEEFQTTAQRLIKTTRERNFTSQLADSHSHSFDTAGCGFQSAVHGPVVCPAHAGV